MLTCNVVAAAVVVYISDAHHGLQILSLIFICCLIGNHITF